MGPTIPPPALNIGQAKFKIVDMPAEFAKELSVKRNTLLFNRCKKLFEPEGLLNDLWNVWCRCYKIGYHLTYLLK
jgi:hypothetical protein